MKHTPRRILRYFYYTQFMRKINNFTQILFRHFGHDLKNPKSYRGKSTIGCMVLKTNHLCVMPMFAMIVQEVSKTLRKEEHT